MVVLEGVKGLVLRVAYSPAGTTFTFSIAKLVWDAESHIFVDQSDGGHVLHPPLAAFMPCCAADQLDRARCNGFQGLILNNVLELCRTINANHNTVTQKGFFRPGLLT